MNRRPTTQDIGWFLDLERNKQLDLDPPYQRRSVWTTKDKQFFLDTIFRNYPCPAVFLHKSMSDDGKQSYHVVDGKQRLETILSFVNNKISISKDFGDTNLAGKKWKDITDPELKRRLWDYVITVEMLPTTEGTIVNEVFDRLNRNSRKLERQELRHAKYDGWFITLAEEESNKDEWKILELATTARAKRMKDVQFLSEIFMIILDKQIVGFDQDNIDEKYAEYDVPEETKPSFSEEDFIQEIQELKSILIEMEKHNSSITTYARNYNNFYTLWAVIALNREQIQTSTGVANKYEEFMKLVEAFNQHDDPETLVAQDREKLTDAWNYYRNSLGASTDLNPRQARYEALLNAIIKK